MSVARSHPYERAIVASVCAWHSCTHQGVLIFETLPFVSLWSSCPQCHAMFMHHSMTVCVLLCWVRLCVCVMHHSVIVCVLLCRVRLCVYTMHHSVIVCVFPCWVCLCVCAMHRSVAGAPRDHVCCRRMPGWRRVAGHRPQCHHSRLHRTACHHVCCTSLLHCHPCSSKCVGIAPLPPLHCHVLLVGCLRMLVRVRFRFMLSIGTVHLHCAVVSLLASESLELVHYVATHCAPLLLMRQHPY